MQHTRVWSVFRYMRCSLTLSFSFPHSQLYFLPIAKEHTYFPLSSLLPPFPAEKIASTAELWKTRVCDNLTELFRESSRSPTPPFPDLFSYGSHSHASRRVRCDFLLLSFQLSISLFFYSPLTRIWFLLPSCIPQHLSGFPTNRRQTFSTLCFIILAHLGRPKKQHCLVVIGRAAESESRQELESVGVNCFGWSRSRSWSR